MDEMFRTAKERGVRHMQLEVIKGNIPAHGLFLRYGFKETRELLVIPPPAPVDRTSLLPQN